MNGDTGVLEFFVNHDNDAPIYYPSIHSVENQDINAPSMEDGVDESNGLLNTQTSRVGKEINSDTNDSEYSEEGSEFDTDASDFWLCI